LLSDVPHSDLIAPSCSSLRSVGYNVPGLTVSRSPLVCSMRRATPNPCCGPSTSSVLRTMRASVPCQTSILSAATFFILDSQMTIVECHDSFGKTTGIDVRPAPETHKRDTGAKPPVGSAYGSALKWCSVAGQALPSTMRPKEEPMTRIRQVVVATVAIG